MTTEQIQQWAKESGMCPIGYAESPVSAATIADLARFAALVLEEAAKKCDAEAEACSSDRDHAGTLAAEACAAVIRVMKGE